MDAAMVSNLEMAKAAMARAEGELHAAVGKVQLARRAEKVAIGAVLARAFTNLRDARTALVLLEAKIEDRSATRNDA